MATTLRLIGDKWKIPVIQRLLDRPHRFNELCRSIDGLSEKVLTDNLARLIQLVADNGANVLEVYHEREVPKTEVNSCTVTLTLEAKDAEHIRKICRDMVESGFPLLD